MHQLSLIFTMGIRQRKSIEDPADRRHASEDEPRRDVGNQRSPLQSLDCPSSQSKEKERKTSEYALHD